MTNRYLRNITPDSFSGYVFAFEGVKSAVVVINGPTGCKFYHSATSDNQSIRQLEFDPLNYPEKWYFGQPRVPCTYLDSRDYVYGSEAKLTETLEFLRDNVQFDMLAIVNSPGAALIGDDLKRIVERTITGKVCFLIETPGFSEPTCLGYETAVNAMVRRLATQALPPEPKVVNVLGLSIFHKNYAGDRLELERLCGLCGIEVNCFVGADCTLDELRRLPRASLNIVLHPEYGLMTAKLLQELHGTPYCVCDGPPIGFSATEKLFSDLCRILDADCSRLTLESERARAKAYVHISRLNSLTGLPKGVPFAVEGDYSEIYAYAAFLVRYFGMVLECASPMNNHADCFKANALDLLRGFGLADALERDILSTQSELVFANGNTIAKLKLRGHRFSGIEIALPTMGYVDVIPKTHLGLTGALALTEQVINGLMFC